MCKFVAENIYCTTAQYSSKLYHQGVSTSIARLCTTISVKFVTFTASKFKMSKFWKINAHNWCTHNCFLQLSTDHFVHVLQLVDVMPSISVWQRIQHQWWLKHWCLGQWLFSAWSISWCWWGHHHNWWHVSTYHWLLSWCMWCTTGGCSVLKCQKQMGKW